MLSSQKHHIDPNYIIIFSGSSSQGSAHGRSQEFEFGAALKQKVQSHGHYVSPDANFSERSPSKQFKIMNDYLGSGDGFPSAWENNLFQLHWRCLAQIFAWLKLGNLRAKLTKNLGLFLICLCM